MPPYDEWNKIDDEEDDELQDASHLESKKDVILFCIDCSESMLELREDPVYENVQTCHAYAALEAAMQIQKKKVITGPSDAVGILLFNTTRKAETSRNQGSEIKRNCFVYQPISPLSAPKIQELIQLLDAFRDDPDELKNQFPPMTDGKRDLTQSGVTVEPFFISTSEKPFDVSKFYSSVLLPNNLVDDDEIDPDDPSVLPESISISRIEDLLSQMRFHEVPKRAQFSIPFQLANGLSIGIKGYGLVTEQKKGAYKYFVDLGERMEVATVRTIYVDEDRQAEVDKRKMLYGMDVGATADDNDDDEGHVASARVVEPGQRPFYTAEEIRAFRTMGMEPSLKLLGFKDRSELQFEDNVKHSLFIYPDEMTFAGSKRTFSALLKSMVKKKKIGLVLSLTRRNASPTFCALVPQEEKQDEAGWTDPAGFHLIPLPFADDIRAAPLETGCRASDEVKNAARAWIDKLSVKNGAYPPDSYPNPALAFHNAQLQATAFGEEFDTDAFEDLTLPKVDMIHKRAGKLIEAWKVAVANDESALSSAPVVEEKRGTKRKADVDISEAEIRSRYADEKLNKLTVEQLKTFLKSKGQSTSGKKADLLERLEDYLTSYSLTNVPTAEAANDNGVSAPIHNGHGNSAIPEDKKLEILENLEDDWQDDPDNPRNWSFKKKWASTAIVSLYTFISPLTSSIMAPGLPEIAEKYHITSSTIIALTLSIFLVSFGIAVTFVSGTSIAGISGSAPIACGGGVISDLFSERDRAAAMAIYSVGPLIGPVVGPIAGGFVTETVGIKWVFIIVAILGGVSGAIGIPILRETYAPIIRMRRDKKSADPEKAALSHPLLVKEHSSKLHYLWINLSRPIVLLTCSPVCFLLSLYMAFTLFTETYGFNTGTSGLTYIGLGVGFLAATGFSAKWANDLYIQLAQKNGGKGEPEMRIPALIAGSLIVPVGLFWYGWSAQAKIHWVMPIIGSGIYGFVHILSSLPIQLYLVQARCRPHRYVVSIVFYSPHLNALQVLRCMLGFGFPLFGKQMFDALGLGGGNSLLGGLTIVLGIPFPIYLYYYGAKIRTSSRLSR
ncbi:hypothetical protein R3P38DRAFT_3303206 [Favolaschia claudopus]|uniref:ATP-dependent DNA helicase II subunit 1 n=1 Tax=Favolaschia claudopus TaxID=2862362 RepID=A0AAW0EBE2_9AGAR